LATAYKKGIQANNLTDGHFMKVDPTASNHSNPSNSEEAWIAKYREALAKSENLAPRKNKVRELIDGVYRYVALRVAHPPQSAAPAQNSAAVEAGKPAQVVHPAAKPRPLGKTSERKPSIPVAAMKSSSNSISAPKATG
jgi:hypothetical protein